MNSKFFVPFETAKQLKEKGYNEVNDYVYSIGVEDGKECIELRQIDYEYLFNDTNSDIDADKFTPNICTAPTYHEVVDWLEGKGIYMHCYSPIMRQNIGQYTAGVFNSNINDWRTCKSVYPTREEALNAAILKALEMI